jgi:hypothetical protein
MWCSYLKGLKVMHSIGSITINWKRITSNWKREEYSIFDIRYQITSGEMLILKDCRYLINKVDSKQWSKKKKKYI